MPDWHRRGALPDLKRMLRRAGFAQGTNFRIRSRIMSNETNMTAVSRARVADGRALTIVTEGHHHFCKMAI
jgi:hypothetical protein